MILPYTTPLNEIRGFQSGTRETASVLHTRDALMGLGAAGDLLNLDSYLIDRPEAVHYPVQFDQGSLLHVASTRGHTGMAQMLIQQRGAAVDRPNYAQQTSLHAACEGNFAAIVVELLCAGADADKRDNLKQTPLHRAAHCGSCDALLALLDYGANTKLRDEGGLAPVHKAALMGRVEALRILLARNPQAVNVEAADGWTPLHFAGHGGHAGAVEVLIQHGAELHSVDSERMTPLHRAASSGSEAACQFLLRAGSDPLLGDSHGMLPLHLVCEAEPLHWHDGMVSVARALIEGGSPVDALDGRRRTPLLIATIGGDLELCEILLSYNADAHYSEPARGVASPISVARRGADPNLRTLLEEYAKVIASNQAQAQAEAARAQLQMQDSEVVKAHAETTAQTFFQEFDRNGDGRVSRRELKNKMASDGEIERLLGMKDAKKRGQLTYRIWEVRKKLDADGDGYISQEELAQLLQMAVEKP